MTLTQAIDAFCRPTRHPNGFDLPSIWDQLCGAIDETTGTGRSSGGSQPPLVTGVLSLTEEIRQHIRWELLSSGCKVTREVPADLRTIAASVDPDTADDWETRVRSWTAQALGIIHPTERPGHLRGTPCADCHQSTVLVTIDRETVRQPALRLVWDGDRIDYVWCAACGESRWPTDLHLIAEHGLALNLTAETTAIR